MIIKKEINCVICDTCKSEIENELADWTYTCSRCGKHFCDSCGNLFNGEKDSRQYFSLCNACFKECEIKNEADQD